MDWNDLVDSLMSDERLLANLVGIHIVLGIILVGSFLVRRLLGHGGNVLVRWTGLNWLDGVNKEAMRGVRSMLFWCGLGLMAATVVSMSVYHVSGRDLRGDLREWYTHLTGGQILGFGFMVGKLIVVSVLVNVAFRLLRKGSAAFEAFVLEHLPKHMPVIDKPALPHHHETREVNCEDTIRRWFFLIERFLLASVILGGVWLAGHIVGYAEQVNSVAGLLLRILAIVTVARLLTLSCRLISHSLASVGNRHLGSGQFTRYWERVTRLFPFGERCFEAAVYIAAASMCVRELDFIAFVASYGTKIVKCIGLFFGTRVVIELLYVFIDEAFGMYDEEQSIDQKGLTLVPLLQSLCQYVLYFGSVLFMLGVFEIDTTPVLAGAGIIGLAGGLGAQSLVTDVVSGFFILFENQYLVGDFVQIGDAIGRVEAVGIRYTQIRDDYGKLIIIPNGQVKTVVNYSKGYVNAVVDIKLPATANLEQVLRDLAEAGRRLRKAHHQVLGETEIKGLIELTGTDMVVRAVTRVQPGTHQAMQQEYRRLLKAVFDESKEATTKALAA